MRNKVILTVGAHPDDMDFAASGTIAKWIQKGAEVYYVICTDGSRGSSDPKMTHKRLVEIREKEQLKAAAVLGAKKVFFLRHVDTQLAADMELKEELVRIIRMVKPDIVIALDPNFYYSEEFINHADHRAAGLAAMDAVFPLSRDRLTFPEHEKQGLMPHKVKEVLFANFREGKYIVEISETLDKKIEVLSCHKSQFDNFSEVEKRVRKRKKEFFNRVKINS